MNINPSHKKSVIGIVSAVIASLNLIFIPSNASSQEPANTLEEAIIAQDTLLFERGFNQCDFAIWDQIFGKEFEFYDDRTGLNTDRTKEVQSFKERCEKAPNLKRRLVSTHVSALGNDHALQIGEHEFLIDNKVIETAKFIHVWRLFNKNWIVSRVISYEHKAAT